MGWPTLIFLAIPRSRMCHVIAASCKNRVNASTPLGGSVAEPLAAQSRELISKSSACIEEGEVPNSQARRGRRRDAFQASRDYFLV